MTSLINKTFINVKSFEPTLSFNLKAAVKTFLQYIPGTVKHIMFNLQPERKSVTCFSIRKLYAHSQQRSWFCLLVINKMMIYQTAPRYKYRVVLHISADQHSSCDTETRQNHQRSVNATALQLLYRPSASNLSPRVAYFYHRLTWFRKYDFNWFSHTLISEMSV